MASKKSFNPPIKISENPDIPRKKKAIQAPAVPMSDEQYEEIFAAVIHPSQEAVDIKSPTIGTRADVFNLNKAASPKESASVENSQQNPPETETETITREEENLRKIPERFSEDIAKKEDPKKVPESSSLSTLHSDDITKEAVFSTPKPTKPKKMKTLRGALKSLKQKLSESFSECSSINESFNKDSVANTLNEGQLSQVPVECTRRERLLWLQERRGTGLYVKCEHIYCRKWRWLDDPDPVDLPDKWYCSMNPDNNYASCFVPEKPIPQYIEDDLIHNCYTAGSIVWAKMYGHPWWPAMVDDCPDVEQYYWINNEIDNVPDWYHVIFFDDREVTRSWIRVKDIKSFKHNPNLEKKMTLKSTLKKRINFAKRKANDALTLHVKDRLKKYSFISVWKKEIPEYPDSDVSDSDVDDSDPNYEQIIKTKILARRRAYIKDNKNSNRHSMKSYKMNDSDSEKPGIVNSKTKKYNKPAKVSDASKKPCRMRADTAVSEKSESLKTNKNIKVVKPAKIFNKQGVDSEKSVEEINKITKPAKVDSVISEQYIEETRKMEKDIDMNEKPVRISRSISAESDLSQKSTIITRRMTVNSDFSDKSDKNARSSSRNATTSEKSARGVSKDSKISDKPAKITRRMSAESDLSQKSTIITRRMTVNSDFSDKSDKKARSSSRNATTSKKSAQRVSKDSKISDKPVKITRRMSAESDLSQKSTIITRRMTVNSDFSDKSDKKDHSSSRNATTSKKSARRVSKDSKISYKPARITRRMSAESDLSQKSDFSDKSDKKARSSDRNLTTSKKSARGVSKDSKISYKPARITRRMSAESDFSDLSDKKARSSDRNSTTSKKSARTVSKDSKLSDNISRIIRSMSAESDLSQKSDKKARSSGRNSTTSKKSARTVSKDSKMSDKPARITRRMSANSKLSEAASSIIDRICADFDSPERVSRVKTVSEKSTPKKAPEKVTKPTKKPILSARRHSEKSFSVIKPKNTSNRKKSSDSVPEKTHKDISVKVSKRKSVSSPTIFEEYRKKDEEMAKRQKIIEDKLKPTKMETIIKKVKKSFRPPIKTSLNQSSSTLSSRSFND